MTRIRSDSIGLRANPVGGALGSYTSTETVVPSATESGIESPLMNPGRLTVRTGNSATETAEEISSIASATTTMRCSLLGDVDVVVAGNDDNNTTATVEENDKPADKSTEGGQQAAIDFASATTCPVPSSTDTDDDVEDDDEGDGEDDGDDKLRCYATSTAVGMAEQGMMVEALEATEIANNSSTAAITEHNGGVATTEIEVEDVKLQMMQTDEDDPLLQETIHALMNGTGGIEVVNGSDTGSNGTSLVAPNTASPAEIPSEEVDTDRNYECRFCGKLFTRSNTLSYHLKVHTGERPFKCKHCAKAFREHYRLRKHLKTHWKHGGCRERDRERLERLQRRERMVLGKEHQQQQRRHHSTILTRSAGAAANVANGIVGTEEDYTTGDSERFFKSYDLPDGTEAMKLEPDISLTEDGVSETIMTETVETSEDNSPPPAIETDSAALAGVSDAQDVRYQILEERMKSLQREVHLVNQNLNRVETKIDGLTRIISLFMGKFEEETDLGSIGAAITQQVASSLGNSNLTVNSLSVVSPHTPPPSIPAVTGSPVQPKAILLTTNAPNAPTNGQQTINSQAQAAVYSPTNVLPAIASVTSVGHPSQALVSTARESRNSAQFFFNETTTHIKHDVETTPSSKPSSTPPQSSQQTHLTSLATNGVTGGMNGGNQLLDTFPEIPELPIRTVSDFLDLNDHCTDNEQFLLQMMIRLHHEIHNSQPFQRNIKRMMEALVTYEVLCQFSWSGKSAINGQYTKYVFGNSLGIIDLLTKTLNLSKSAEQAEANQKPIFAAIQSFIKHSRQNMIRDSRKRRDPARGFGLPTGVREQHAAVADSTTATAYLNGGAGVELQPQMKQIKSEYQHHHPAELVNPF